VLAVVAREQGEDMRLELASRRLHASAPSSYSTRYADSWVSGSSLGSFSSFESAMSFCFPQLGHKHACSQVSKKAYSSEPYL